MSFPAAVAFRKQFSALSKDEAEAYVADLWQARGWNVEREGKRLRLTRSRDEPAKTLYVPGNAPGEGLPQDADIVITTTDATDYDVPGGVEVVAPAGLYRMTKYAIDRDESERLLAAHFDGIETESDASDDSQNIGGERETGRDGDPGDAVASDDGVDGAPVNRSTSERESGDGAAVETESNRDSTDRKAGDASTDSPGTQRLSRRTMLITGGVLFAGLSSVLVREFSGDTEPPVESAGLTDEGVVDPTALAEAHVAEIEDRSYSLAFTLLRNDADRSLRSYLSMDLALAADRTYLAHVSTDGPEAPKFLGEAPATAVFWSDSDSYLVQRPPEKTQPFTEFEPPDGHAGTWKYWARTIPFGGTYGSRPGRYFQTVFEAIPTRLVERLSTDGTDQYRIASDGTKPSSPSKLGDQGLSGIRDVRLGAVVDQHSVIRSFELQFVSEIDGDRIEHSRTLGYSALGETDVERPVSVE